MRNPTDEFFQNNIQQAEIELKLTEAIPPGIYYHNLVLALTNMLRRAVWESYKELVYTKKVSKDEQAK